MASSVRRSSWLPFRREVSSGRRELAATLREWDTTANRILRETRGREGGGQAGARASSGRTGRAGAGAIRGRARGREREARGEILESDEDKRGTWRWHLRQQNSRFPRSDVTLVPHRRESSEVRRVRESHCSLASERALFLFLQLVFSACVGRSSELVLANSRRAKPWRSLPPVRRSSLPQFMQCAFCS